MWLKSGELERDRGIKETLNYLLKMYRITHFVLWVKRGEQERERVVLKEANWSVVDLRG